MNNESMEISYITATVVLIAMYEM